MRIPEPSFKHVLHLTDEQGMFEHADGITPRYDGGYCLDDVARALVVVCRQRPLNPHPGAPGRSLPGVRRPLAGAGRPVP